MKIIKQLLTIYSFILSITQANAGADSLLGVQLGYPNLEYTSNTGQGALYDGSKLVITSVPRFITLTAGTTPEFVISGDLNITAYIDSAGNFTSGTFSISGTAAGYTGILLSGNILDYGILELGVADDLIDFRLNATSGSMQGLFTTTEVGTIVTLEGSTFDGNGFAFGSSWGAVRAKGTFGPIPDIVPSTGTATIGYWKNHEAEWPTSSLTLGNNLFTKIELLSLLTTPTRGDKTIAMAKQLITSKLNVLAGNESSCVDDIITASDAWLQTHEGVGSGERRWGDGDLLHDDLDTYNNGQLCAPHRD